MSIYTEFKDAIEGYNKAYINRWGGENVLSLPPKDSTILAAWYNNIQSVNRIEYKSSPYIQIGAGTYIIKEHLDRVIQAKQDIEDLIRCNSCSGTCSQSCSANCGNSCGSCCYTGCTGCNGCSGCSGCSGGSGGSACFCTNNIQWCYGCSYWCNGCSGCGGCSGNCQSSCGRACTSCSGGCGRSCSGSCQSGCSRSCSSGCSYSSRIGDI